MPRLTARIASALALALAATAALADGVLSRAEIEDALYARSWKHFDAEGAPASNTFRPGGRLEVRPERGDAVSVGRFRFEGDRICIRMDASGVERCWQVSARDDALIFSAGDRRNILTRR